jgi:hypothetical protein
MTLLNGQYHYVPDFLVRLKTKAASYLTLKTKGYVRWLRGNARWPNDGLSR